LVPPDEVIVAELEAQLESKVRAIVTERILREAEVEKQIVAALATIERPSAANLTDGIERLFKSDPERQWRDHVETMTNAMSESA
jgi:hypothetical protein